jgi:hypothetical protein
MYVQNVGRSIEYEVGFLWHCISSVVVLASSIPSLRRALNLCNLSCVLLGVLQRYPVCISIPAATPGRV